MRPSSASIDYCETFRLSDDCIGVIWNENDGWHGNLHWDIEGDTDFCGPYLSIIMARQAVRAAFVQSESTGKPDQVPQRLITEVIPSLKRNLP